MMTREVTLRPLQSQADYLQCVALQKATWGADFGECVPPSILLATQKVGSVAAGAFDADGRLLGFVFGLSGLRDGRPAHWSDMLAVHEDARGRGLGRRLKAYQRQLLLEGGIEVAYWTYDPLEAGNAYININRLGALPIEYVPDMYGDATGSPLHSGLTTDRLVVEWKLTDPRVEALLAGQPSAGQPDAPLAPVVNSDFESDAPRVRIEIPFDIQTLKKTSMDKARSWRQTVRRAFLYYIEAGYRVTGFQRDLDTRHCFYILERS